MTSSGRTVAVDDDTALGTGVIGSAYDPLNRLTARR